MHRPLPFKELSDFIKNTTDERYIVIDDDETEGVKIDQDHHFIIYDDREIRILNVYLPPGVTGAAHQHGFPAIFYEDMPSDYLMIEDIAQGISHQQTQVNPSFEYTGPESLHIVTNLDTVKPYWGFRFEIKKIQFIEDPVIQLAIKQFIESKKEQFDDVRRKLLTTDR